MRHRPSPACARRRRLDASRSPRDSVHAVRDPYGPRGCDPCSAAVDDPNVRCDRCDRGACGPRCEEIARSVQRDGLRVGRRERRDGSLSDSKDENRPRGRRADVRPRDSKNEGWHRGRRADVRPRAPGARTSCRSCLDIDCRREHRSVPRWLAAHDAPHVRRDRHGRSAEQGVRRRHVHRGRAARSTSAPSRRIPDSPRSRGGPNSRSGRCAAPHRRGACARWRHVHVLLACAIRWRWCDEYRTIRERDLGQSLPWWGVPHQWRDGGRAWKKALENSTSNVRRVLGRRGAPRPPGSRAALYGRGRSQYGAQRVEDRRIVNRGRNGHIHSISDGAHDLTQDLARSSLR